MKTVEANKAAGNFTKFLSQVHTHQKSIAILLEGVPCAYLIPAGDPNCDSHGFADDLAGNELANEDRRGMTAAVRRGRKALKPLKNPRG
jgi:PHD/YefM family antitoxin component YafN of YafNO toxin-antitoxin module